jgi:hypothetical protein
MPHSRYSMVHMDHPNTLASLATVVAEALDATALSDREIEAQTGIARTTLKRRLADGDFRFVSELAPIARLLGVKVHEIVRQAEEPAA